MGMFYGHIPPPPEEQQARLAALLQLTSRGIPCILWGEDALNYVYKVPTTLFDQQILVPDSLMRTASEVLQEGKYVPVPFTQRYFDNFGYHSATSMFPHAILLKHPDIPDEDPYKLDPLPGYILLLPQSYYGLDVRERERFQSMSPPLDPSYARIVVPKYHTFLEGLVRFMIHPPFELTNPHRKGIRRHQIFIGYLVRYRVEYEGDPREVPTRPYPEEDVIVSELETDEARWFINKQFKTRLFVTIDEMLKYRDSHPSS
ncbi:hypothetical protein EIP86_005414 [Pleurotus ostreatoroseus]|nr:hypothetical protein EIP86_005414 [Pleurotus ostreatoroseus]